jgi:hypothetical protein
MHAAKIEKMMQELLIRESTIEGEYFCWNNLIAFL